jgi:antirestriction protein ArdC
MTSERAEVLHAELIAKVESFRSSSEWLEAMAVAASFHDYSFGNWLLLWSQAEARGTTVTRPAGYRTWQQLGRQVQKGERGYRILAPIVRRFREEDAKGIDQVRRVVTGFRVVTVFDVAQTTGEALPDVGPRPLVGVGDVALQAAAINMIETEGFSFAVDRINGPNGVTYPTQREVIVDDRLSGAQRTKTTLHELAHVLLHADGPIDCRGRVEVEAESVAFVVSAAVGADTSSYSVAYIAGWAERTPDPAQVLLASAERIVRTSRRIIEHTNHIDTNRNEAKCSSLSQQQPSEDNDMMTGNAVRSVGAVT